ncbi:MAG: UbiA-like protein EboC [Cyanophyceae cyanobacterium]
MNTTLKPPFWAYLQLMRPANIVTAWADILAGFAAAGIGIDWVPLVWLLLATTGLYGGGVVFNDVFDAELDAQERPERPIPSDRISRTAAIGLGSVLLAVGILAAAQVSLASTILAGAIALAALVYDAYSKHHPLLGPLNMGLCRGGNLLLGISAVPAATLEQPFLALIPIAYIAAVTAISQGEVHGGKSRTGWGALALLALVLGSLIALGLLPNYALLRALPFVLLLAGRVLPPFIQATRHPSAEFIRAAVKRGVLSLILLDASLAAGFADSLAGLLVLGLLPLSIALARLFTVT